MDRHASANVVHVVTWNVNDNSKMRDGYSDSAMDKVIVILIAFKPWFPLWVSMKKDELEFEDDFLFQVISQWKRP